MRRVRTTTTIHHDDGTTSEMPRGDVWTLPGSTVGYVVNRNGIAVARYGNRWKSLRMPFTPGNRRRATMAAEAWLRGLQGGWFAVSAPTTLLWSDAWHQYSTAMLRTDGTITERRNAAASERAVRLFIADDVAVNDASALSITDAGVRTLDQRFGASAAQRYVQVWGQFLRYCRARGWLGTDPLELVRRPRQVSKGPARVYSPRELLRIDRWLAANGGTRATELRLLGRFLVVTGARIHEALALRWSDVHADHIAMTVTKGGHPRSFPIAPWPELGRTLDRLRAIRRDDRLFPWRNPKPVVRAMTRCLGVLGIDGGPRPVHVLRATATARWRRSGVPAEVRARLAGHDVRIMLDRYDAEATATELADAVMAAAVTRERGGTNR